MDTTTSALDDVKLLVAETLGIQDRLDSMDASTKLLGEVPELDSLAVVQLLIALEGKFGFEVADADFTGDVFDTFGTLAAFVDANRT